MKKSMHPILKILIIVIAVILVIVLGYLVYVFFSYHRIPDKQKLTVNSAVDSSLKSGDCLTTDTEYTIMTYNIGFGAYIHDFSFFMDGGESSWAKSKESVIDTVNGAADMILSLNPDMVLLQEIDFDSTRSYHVNELTLLQNKMSGYDNTLAVNYDSAFLMYPINQPHGTSRAGVGTFSKHTITDSVRRSLPITASLSKFTDLDRCYSVNRISIDNGKELVLINVHMSAYGSNPQVREGQTTMLMEEMEKEYAAGNYVIIGGDFNHDLKKTEDSGDVSWAHYYDRSKIPEHFGFVLDTIDPSDDSVTHNTCRDSGVEYSADVSTITLDGFIISDNIEMVTYENYDAQFLYSDHDPVVMRFILK